MCLVSPSSLPDERAKARATLELSPPPPAELRQSPETAVTQGETRAGDGGGSEQRRSRIRERRREGRCKTFDWADFQKDPPPGKEEPDGGPAKAPDVADAGSVSISSAASTPASSPPESSVVSSSSSSSGAAPREAPAAVAEELEQERARRREERRRRFQTPPSGTAASLDGEVRTPGDQERMEVDGPPHGDGGRGRGKPPDVQVEIEQRWHQVETTPLREEKQVPIATVHSSDPTAERPPPQELAALLDKEVRLRGGGLMRVNWSVELR